MVPHLSDDWVDRIHYRHQLEIFGGKPDLPHSSAEI